MSMLLMVQAMKIRVGNPLRKLVLIKLADNASDLGECWPSYQHIADQCEISKRSVMNHIAALCECGLLRKEIRKGGPKGNSSNVYFLSLDAAAASGVVQQMHQGSERGSPPSAGDSLGGSAGAAPRTSHSSESVIEPVIEPLSGDAAATPGKAIEGELLPADSRDDGEGSRTALSTKEPRVVIPDDMPGPRDQSCKTFKTWANYAFAYRQRYTVWPLWNAAAGGMIGKFIDKVGGDVAHKVAAYYLRANDEAAIRCGHSLEFMVKNFQRLHTQWLTGRSMTATRAKQLDQSQANHDAADEAFQLLMERRRQKEQDGKHADD